jgi:hypothetical protein
MSIQLDATMYKFIVGGIKLYMFWAYAPIFRGNRLYNSNKMVFCKYKEKNEVCEVLCGGVCTGLCILAAVNVANNYTSYCD